VIDTWLSDHLKNIRFSGGEPTLYQGLPALVGQCHNGGAERIAISTNGTASLSYYGELINAGLDDICISLDASAASRAREMAGVPNTHWKNVVRNIRELSRLTYVTTSIVLTPNNAQYAKEIIRFSSDLGVSDIRIVTASHSAGDIVEAISGLDQDLLERFPILKYRVQNYLNGRNVRGIQENDAHRCHLVKDDCVVAGKWHYPCGVYLREKGAPIGEIGPRMRNEGIAWFQSHNTFQDRICRQFCSDIYIDYNNRCERISNLDSSTEFSYSFVGSQKIPY
jgi:MoaA/NifB/PqqE/SkfB family radical SAM enzyme